MSSINYVEKQYRGTYIVDYDDKDLSDNETEALKAITEDIRSQLLKIVDQYGAVFDPTVTSGPITRFVAPHYVIHLAVSENTCRLENTELLVIRGEYSDGPALYRVVLANVNDPKKIAKNVMDALTDLGALSDPNESWEEVS